MRTGRRLAVTAPGDALYIRPFKESLGFFQRHPRGEVCCVLAMTNAHHLVSRKTELQMLRKLKSFGYSANISYALGFLSVIASIAIWFTMGGTGNEVDAAAGERFGIFIGLWAPTFMAIGNGIDNLKDES